MPADAVILAVAHHDYVAGGWPLVTRLLKGGKGIVLDVKSKLDRAQKPEQHRIVAAVNPILVTGAAGFIGFHVARRLLEAGREVVGVDNLIAYYDPTLKEARLRQLAGRQEFPIRAARSRRSRGHRGAVRRASLSARHSSRGAGGRAAFAGRPACLCRRQPRRLPQRARRLPPQRLPASAFMPRRRRSTARTRRCRSGLRTTSIIRSACTARRKRPTS